MLAIGPPGIGKQALSYRFIQEGLEQGDVCVYITRLPVAEIMHDARSFGFNRRADELSWILRQGAELQIDKDGSHTDSLLEELEGLLARNKDRRIRIATDILSPILILNSQIAAYRFADRLVSKVKELDAVMVATLEAGMHPPEAIAAMQQLFDGYLELKLYEVGLTVVPILRIGKMRGFVPQAGFLRFQITRQGVDLTPAGPNLAALLDEPKSLPPDALSGKPEASAVLECLVKSFRDDYLENRLPLEQSGWRTRGAVLESTNLPQRSLYGNGAVYGPALRALLEEGLVEIRFFPKERGRGGEILKMRIAYEKARVRSWTDAHYALGGAKQ